MWCHNLVLGLYVKMADMSNPPSETETCGWWPISPFLSILADGTLVEEQKSRSMKDKSMEILTYQLDVAVTCCSSQMSFNFHHHHLNVSSPQIESATCQGRFMAFINTFPCVFAYICIVIVMHLLHVSGLWPAVELIKVTPARDVADGHSQPWLVDGIDELSVISCVAFTYCLDDGLWRMFVTRPTINLSQTSPTNQNKWSEKLQNQVKSWKNLTAYW